MPQPRRAHDPLSTPFALRRRRLLQTTGTAALVGAATRAVDPGSPALAAPAPAEQRVTLRQGTNTMVAASPDGRWLALDLVVSIWVLPAAGGDARRLTGDLQDATRPAFSPDGRTIAFQSYRDGNYHVWTVRRDGSRLTQHTRGAADHREPAWLPDGSGLVLSSDRGGTGSYGLWRLDLASGRLSAVLDSAGEEGEPSVSPDGRRVAFSVGTSNTGGTRIDEAALDGSGRRTVVGARDDGSTAFGPSYSPEGRLAHVRLTGATTTLVVDGEDVATPEDADVCCLPPAWVSEDEVVHVVDGRLTRIAVDSGNATRLGFAATVAVTSSRPTPRTPDLADRSRRRALGIASPVASPDGSRIAFRALNALWVADATGGRPRRVVSDGYFSSDPDFTPDGESLVYASDRAGEADLWRHDLATGRDVRLTALPGAQTAPRVSPTGRYVAYHDQDGAGFVVDLEDASVRQVHDALFQPGRMSWTPDESTLVLAAVRPYSARFREGTSQLLYVDVASGDLEYVAPMPDRSLSTRGDDGPVVSPDGRRAAFVVESRLYVVPLEPGTFRPRGVPRELTDEVTDAPVWLDDRTLLTLSNGRLRRHPLRGRARTVPLDLSYSPARTERAEVVHAGALWDGSARSLRRDVDVLVRDGRVQQVRDHRGTPDVDASDLTVMPGLVDAHNHWHLRGRAWGARQGRLWLSYGITSTRSPGDPAYQMAETREALRAGTLVGPRFFATGEAIDGSRVYYNFMRPTLSATQLRREVERVAGLDYDLVKTYVRLPVVLQRRAVGLVHRLGLRLSSHYLYPAERIGMDGQEHTGATNRLGYSHTVTRLGRSYGDAVTLFTASGMSITPTLFNSTVVHVDDPSLVEDRRTRTLFPSWEYQLLLDEVATAAGPAGETTRALLAGNVEMVRRIHDGGGFVIAGTDAPLDNVAVSLHANLRAMVGGGMTPYDVLRTATVNPARWLGLEGQLGVVEPGAQADLSFVRGDPLADVDAAAAVERVMVGGRSWTVDELLAAYDDGSGGTGSPGGRAADAPAAIGPDAAPEARDWRLGDHAEGEYWWHEPEWLHRACCED